MLSEATAAHPAWIVFIRRGTDRPMARPAAFVFDTPTGFLWIEPGYYNEPGTNSSPQIHMIDAIVEQSSIERWTFAGARTGAIEKYEIGEDADIVGDALEWFATRFLPSQPESLSELRIAVAERLREEGVQIL